MYNLRDNVFSGRGRKETEDRAREGGRKRERLTEMRPR
jgi:hypothetical protein